MCIRASTCWMKARHDAYFSTGMRCWTRRQQATMQSLGAYNVDDPGAFDAQVQPCSQGSPNSCIFVTITYDYSAHPIVPPAPGLGLVTPSKLSSKAVVQVS